jgi:c-di-GMP-binding flagellar brake protein YcgR
MTVRLNEPPRPWNLLRPEICVQVSLSVASKLYLMDMQIRKVRDTVVNMTPSAVVATVQRRRYLRRNHEAPVLCRLIRSDGTTGRWQEAQMHDISQGGISLTLYNNAQIPQFLEVEFTLPPIKANQHGESGDIELYTDPRATQRHERLDNARMNRPIHARSIVRHAKQLPDGRLRIGLEFNEIERADMIRIVTFVDMIRLAPKAE